MGLFLPPLGKTCSMKGLILIRSSHRLSGRESTLSDLVTAVFSPPEIRNQIFKNKFNKTLSWYEELTGINEVRIAQDRVIRAQETFAASQENRRRVMHILSEQQARLKEIYSDLEYTNRGEERYLQLITKEHALLKDEKVTRAQLEEAERGERDCFLALTTFVKESHSKEKAQSEKVKYWSIIGSIIGTTIGVVGTSVTNFFRTTELKKLIQEKVITSDTIARELINNEVVLLKKLTESNDLGTREEKMLRKSLEKLDRALSDFKKTVRTVNGDANSISSTEMAVLRLEDAIKNQHRQRVYECAALAFVAVVIVLKIFGS